MAGLRVLVLTAALLAAVCAVHGRTARGVGTPTLIRHAPWLAQLEYAGDRYQYGTTSMACVGSIIDSTHILSAAHCFEEKIVADPSGWVQVRVGATEKRKGGVTYSVQSVHVHPRAQNGDNEMYDLAVVVLRKPIEFNLFAEPIQMVKKAVPAGSHVFGGGWGQTPNRLFSPTLLTFEMTKDDRQECQKFLEKTSGSAPEHLQGLMCMTRITGGPCGGDSGSGLWLPVDYANDQPARLVGVLHGGRGHECSQDDGIGLYVDILDVNNRDFLSQFFDMSGMEATGSVLASDPPAKKVKGLFGMLEEITNSRKETSAEVRADIERIRNMIRDRGINLD